MQGHLSTSFGNQFPFEIFVSSNSCNVAFAGRGTYNRVNMPRVPHNTGIGNITLGSLWVGRKILATRYSINNCTNLPHTPNYTDNMSIIVESPFKSCNILFNWESVYKWFDKQSVSTRY